MLTLNLIPATLKASWDRINKRLAELWNAVENIPQVNKFI